MKTKSIRLMLPAIGGAIALFTHTTLAQSWQTVDDFQYQVGSWAQARAGTADSQGNLYIVGSGLGPGGTGSGIMHALVMRTSDGGGTWTMIDDYSVGTGHTCLYNAIGSDLAGNLYAVGVLGALKQDSLFVRKSVDNGATWATILTFPLPCSFVQPGTPAFSVDGSGAIYAAGYGGYGGTANSVVLKSTDAGATWVLSLVLAAPMNGMISTPSGLFVSASGVRKSADGGVTWKTVDTYGGSGICSDALGNIYTGGLASVSPGRGKPAVNNIVIRRGSNGGTVWQTLATVPTPGFTGGFFYALHFDPAGNGYASAVLNPADGSAGHWIVEKSLNQGLNWSVADDFQLAAGYNAYPWFITHDLAGSVYVGGFPFGSAATSIGEHWVVRKQVGP